MGEELVLRFDNILRRLARAKSFAAYKLVVEPSREN